MLRGNTLSLRTNAGLAQNKYYVSRNVAGVFSNESSTEGQEWWVNNRLYWHLNKSITPFVGHTVSGYRRDAFVESGSIQSARSVGEVSKTENTGEVGLSLTHRFGGKKNDKFGIGVEASVKTNADVEVLAAVDYNQTIYLEGLQQISDGVNNTIVSAKVKFRF
jgi:opacity protein-like surface antigen